MLKRIIRGAISVTSSLDWRLEIFRQNSMINIPQLKYSAAREVIRYLADIKRIYGKELYETLIDFYIVELRDIIQVYRESKEES